MCVYVCLYVSMCVYVCLLCVSILHTYIHVSLFFGAYLIPIHASVLLNPFDEYVGLFLYV